MVDQDEITAQAFFFFSPLRLSEPLKLKESLLFIPKPGKIPDAGFTMIYGYRSAGLVYKEAYASSKSTKSDIARLAVNVLIGTWPVHKQTLETLANYKFLDLSSKAESDVMDDIKKKWNFWLKEEGKPSENFPYCASRNMHLLDRLIRLPTYSHITVIAYPFSSTAGPIKLVTVFDESSIRKDTASVLSKSGVDISVEF